MSLPKSLITTFLIIAVIWGALVWSQSARTGVAGVVRESQLKGIVSLKNSNHQLGRAELIALVGLSDHVELTPELEEVNALWQKFYGQTDLHMQVSVETASKVYGYYQFTDQTDTAKLTIGYSSLDSLSEEYPMSEEVVLSDLELLSENNPAWDTSAGWSKIDGNRVLGSVLEEYLLSASGDVIANNVYVLYR